KGVSTYPRIIHGLLYRRDVLWVAFHPLATRQEHGWKNQIENRLVLVAISFDGRNQIRMMLVKAFVYSEQHLLRKINCPVTGHISKKQIIRRKQTGGEID